MWIVFGCVLGLTMVAQGCELRTLEASKWVCACTSASCDPVVEEGLRPSPGAYHLYTSSILGQRLEKTEGTMGPPVTIEGAVRYTVDAHSPRQTLEGFGGAMTDAAGINIASLSPPMQDKLLRSYFGAEGLNYSMVRVPIAGTDFSTHTYSYCDLEGDVSLSSFNLSIEDFQYKIPLLRAAQALALAPLKLVAAPWSAPKWMKTNNEFYGKGKLKPEYWQPWADYIIKFLDAYATEGLPIWGLSPQNEPTDGLNEGFPFNCMGWEAAEMREWLANHLGPALRNSSHASTNLYVMDDQRAFLQDWLIEVLNNTAIMELADGIALHWYMDDYLGPWLLDNAHENFPDFPLLYTEASTGLVQLGEPAVDLGAWQRAERYAKDVIEDLDHWVTGFIDWNLALDFQGGPNWAKNFVDSAIIVDAAKDEFLRQPIFYALAHFARFLDSGAVAVPLVTTDDTQGTMAAAARVARTVVVVILNRGDTNVTAIISDERFGGHGVFQLGPHSLHTVVYGEV